VQALENVVIDPDEEIFRATPGVLVALDLAQYGV
jgi:hypothetical protein